MISKLLFSTSSGECKLSYMHFRSGNNFGRASNNDYRLLNFPPSNGFEAACTNFSTKEIFPASHRRIILEAKIIFARKFFTRILTNAFFITVIECVIGVGGGGVTFRPVGRLVFMLLVMILVSLFIALFSFII